MNTHKNARLTYRRRLDMVHDITAQGMSVPQAASCHGVTAATARKRVAEVSDFLCSRV